MQPSLPSIVAVLILKALISLKPLNEVSCLPRAQRVSGVARLFHSKLGPIEDDDVCPHILLGRLGW